MREVDLMFTCERDIFNVLHVGGGEIFFALLAPINHFTLWKEGLAWVFFELD